MKGSLCLFLSGSLLGLALGLGLGFLADADGWGEGRNAGSGQAGGPGRGPDGTPFAAGAAGQGEPAKAGPRPEGGQAAHGTGKEIIELVMSLSRIDDIEEVNFMELIRGAFSVTQMGQGEVLALLESLDDPEFRAQLGQTDDLADILGAVALTRLAEVNGPEAFRILMEAPDSSFLAGDRDEFAAMCMNTWVSANPEGALRWLEEARSTSDEALSEIVNDPELNAAVVSALARGDRDEAARYLDSIDEDSRVEGIEVMARYEDTAEGMRQLLEATGEAEISARQRVLGEWSDRDPEAAVAWLDEQAPGEGKAALVQQVAQNYLNRDSAAATEWYMAQELSPEHDDGRYRMITQTLASQDPGAAGDWLEQQPDGPSRDGAEGVLVRTLANRGAYEEAFGWLEGIGEGESRDQVQESVFRSGVNREGEATPELRRAAEAAGLADALDAYVESRNKN